MLTHCACLSLAVTICFSGIDLLSTDMDILGDRAGLISIDPARRRDLASLADVRPRLALRAHALRRALFVREKTCSIPLRDTTLTTTLLRLLVMVPQVMTLPVSMLAHMPFILLLLLNAVLFVP